MMAISTRNAISVPVVHHQLLASLRGRPPTVACAYLYDEHGSALYEQITDLPEYYPARTEEALLRELASELAALTPARELVELGCGSSRKTLPILRARQTPLSYVPIDVSAYMLAACAERLRIAVPFVKVAPVRGLYLDALKTLAPSADRLCVFLGGTFGNLGPGEQEALLAVLRERLLPGASFLVGFDLAPHAGKPAEVILRAYDDAAGVTARFNLNVLAHLNRVAGGSFVLDRWEHAPHYDIAAQQIEMHVRARVDQDVMVAGERFHFAMGDTIRTEISRKFNPDMLAEWFSRHGFSRVRCWTDPRRYFGLMLVRR